MGVISWIVLGILLGGLTRQFMPCKDPVTTPVAIAGAFAGGLIGSFFGIGGIAVFSLLSLVVALAGALFLLYTFCTI